MEEIYAYDGAQRHWKQYYSAVVVVLTLRDWLLRASACGNNFG